GAGRSGFRRGMLHLVSSGAVGEAGVAGPGIGGGATGGGATGGGSVRRRFRGSARGMLRGRISRHRGRGDGLLPGHPRFARSPLLPGGTSCGPRRYAVATLRRLRGSALRLLGVLARSMVSRFVLVRQLRAGSGGVTDIIGHGSSVFEPSVKSLIAADIPARSWPTTSFWRLHAPAGTADGAHEPRPARNSAAGEFRLSRNGRRQHAQRHRRALIQLPFHAAQSRSK